MNPNQSPGESPSSVAGTLMLALLLLLLLILPNAIRIEAVRPMPREDLISLAIFIPIVLLLIGGVSLLVKDDDEEVQAPQNQPPSDAKKP